MKEKIDAIELEPNKIILVKGYVTFSKVMSKFEGEELTRREAEAQRRNPKYIPKNAPYGTITIKDAEIIPEVKGQLSINERYIDQQFYQSGTDLSFKYSKDIPSNLPFIAEKKADGSGYLEIEKPSGELATGLEIILVLRTFKPKRYNKIGVAVYGILVEEEMKYFEGNSIKAALAKRGIIIDDSQAREYSDKKATVVQRENVQSMPKDLETNSANDLFSSNGITIEENIDKLPY